jgi:hypothetical protein
MITGLQVEIKGRSPGPFPGLAQRQDLCVGLSCSMVVATADDGLSFDNDGTHHGIRARFSHPLHGQPEGQSHEFFIDGHRRKWVRGYRPWAMGN